MHLPSFREIKIEAARVAFTSIAFAGSVVLILGSTSCFLGLSGTGLIKLGELLKPHRIALKTTMLYGSAASGSGLFLIGAALAISKVLEQYEIEELTRFNNSDSSVPFACEGCKYFNGSNRVVCAVHPYGVEGETCPDKEV